ncbi:MAG: hypothetical protein ACRDNW_00790 [Trebonia sp.]
MPPDECFVYLSDILPTAWQAVEYAGIPPGGTVTVFGLGPVGQFATPDRPAPPGPGDGVDYVPNGGKWPADTASRYSIPVLRRAWKNECATGSLPAGGVA